MKGHTYISNEVDPQGYVSWSDVENDTWNKLVSRQVEIVPKVASKEFLHGLEILDFNPKKVPQIPEINKILDDCTGWGVEPVPAIIQPAKFFELLTKKRFPAATFIRIPEELDYLQEPDIFHEVYGHTPLLTNKAYASFMEEFGKIALQAQPKDRRRLFRLFWFTIEFGLLKQDGEFKAYGGGILSSIGESKYCLTDESQKQRFNVIDALRTPYRIDIMQPLYYYLESFDELFTILDADILKAVEEAKALGDFEPAYPPKELDDDLDDEEGMGAMKC